MAIERSVLILADSRDSSAQRVEAMLGRMNHQVHVLDLRDFPLRMTYSAISGVRWEPDFGGERSFKCRGPFDAIYLRRPGVFEFADGMVQEHREFCELEARAGVLGSLVASCDRWINDPIAELRANYKPIQLALAAEFGLSPPMSLVSNDVAEVERFLGQCGGTLIYKGMGHYLSRNPSSVPLPKTRLVRAHDIGAGIAATANLFQERIQKSCDIRLTVVGNYSFAAKIYTGQTVDWRSRAASARYVRTEVPSEVAGAVAEIMKRLQLTYGAFDFVLDREGAWRFLEVNPNGQWLWLEERLSLPITEAIAETLIDTHQSGS